MQQVMSFCKVSLEAQMVYYFRFIVIELADRVGEADRKLWAQGHKPMDCV